MCSDGDGSQVLATLVTTPHHLYSIILAHYLNPSAMFALADIYWGNLKLTILIR